MQANEHRRVKTFTIGFNESAFDEAAMRARSPQHLGTDHHRAVYVARARRSRSSRRCRLYYDEPFADSFPDPDLPRLCAARRARHRGALGRWRRRALRRLHALPQAARNRRASIRDVARCLRPTVAAPSAALRHAAGACWSRSCTAGSTSRRCRRACTSSAVSCRQAPRTALFRGLVATGQSRGARASAAASRRRHRARARWPERPRLRPAHAADRHLTYLPDDILVKVDRASMARQPRGARAAARSSGGRVRVAPARCDARSATAEASGCSGRCWSATSRAS